MPNIEPTYRCKSPSESILIREDEPVEILAGSSKHRGKATVEIDWLPQPRVAVKCQLDSTQGLGPDADEVKLTLLSVGSSVRALPTNWTVGTGGASVTLIPQGEPIEAIAERKLQYVIFHLVNFPTLFGVPSTIGLEGGGWRVSIVPLPEARGHLETMKQSGGFSVTYVGTIEQVSGELFDIGDAKDLLECLRYLFTFARGQWAPPILPVGYNSSEAVVWERWSLPSVDSWKYVLSWFDWHHGDSLSVLFPGFIRKWADEVWQKALRSSIYWYIRSNSLGAGTDGSVILTQAALELLSWTLHVENRGGLSKAGFQRLPASDQLRLLLAHSDVPLSIPSELTDIRKLAQEFNWDGADAFTHLRNSIVHPGHVREAAFYEGGAVTEG